MRTYSSISHSFTSLFISNCCRVDKKNIEKNRLRIFATRGQKQVIFETSIVVNLSLLGKQESSKIHPIRRIWLYVEFTTTSNP